MQTIEYLIQLADDYKRCAGVVEDTTVSYRVFRDSKKLTAIRSGADITLRRFNAAVIWFQENWPQGCEMPAFETSQKAS
ncbi:hypothetical protein BMI88_11025 [Thioclava sp. F36-6]|nr:hypothetical protein BMI88_11025 [Thioclava sp. F36-6]